jgi:hypothetical protein
MLFTIKNLGRLEEASIDLGKDVILLTGPNNTSKTYVAYSIYGLCTRIDAILYRFVVDGLLKDAPRGDNHIDLLLHAWLTNSTKTVVDQVAEAYARAVPEVLAADEKLFPNVSVQLRPDAGPVLRQTATSLASDFTSRLDPHTQLVAGVGVLEFVPLPGGVRAMYPSTSKEDPTFLRNMLETAARGFASQALSESLFPSLLSPYILAAERSAIQLFSRELAVHRADLVDQLLGSSAPEQRVALRFLHSRARRYAVPLSDGIRIANSLDVLRRRQSPFAPFADWLEKHILGGSTTVSEDKDLVFAPEGSDVVLPMALASSTVKSLAPLSFYLRHIAKKEDFLIIDEPELNLHPDNQRLVARLLARLSRAGIKVLMSTHSDYVIRELNNLIMLHADKTGELRSKHGYREDEVLDPARVGAYLFDARKANRIEVGEMGVAVETIDREINKMSAVSQDLFYSLFAYKG